MGIKVIIAFSVGRYIQRCHDILNKSIQMKLVSRIDINGPAIGLFAVKEILVGQELRYPYGDEPEKLWWRKHKEYVKPRFIKNGCPVVDSAEFPICVVGNVADRRDAPSAEYSVHRDSGFMPICMVGNVADMSDAPSADNLQWMVTLAPYQFARLET